MCAISLHCAIAVQVPQEVSQAYGIVRDRGTTPSFATFLQICVDIANAEAPQSLLIGVRTESSQESERMRSARVPRQRVQSTQIAQPRVVALHDLAVKCFQRRSGWIGDRPSTVYQV